jgi:hypothetical protein
MMTEYNIVMVRSPGLTEDEIERRLREAYDHLFAFADRRAADKKDAPAEGVEARAGASGGQPVTNHQEYGTSEPVMAQAISPTEGADDDDTTP